MGLTGKPVLASSATFVNDGFWPDLLIADLLSRYRVQSDVPDDVVPTALQLAVIRLNAKLDDVKAEIITLGYNSLAAYTADNSEQMNGKEVMLIKYEHAAYSRAKAGLIPQFTNSVSRPKGDGETMDEADHTEQFWLDECQTVVAEFHSKFFPLDDAIPSTANSHVALL